MFPALAVTRPYFSVVDRLKDYAQTPLKHIRSFVEPDGIRYDSQLPEGYRTHGNTAAAFASKLTGRSLDLHQWHDVDSTVHTQFGTVDNPVLVFTSDSSWRIVVCMGPSIEDDSHSHEKIYYFVREGPINRCQVCGQCFKIVRLRDESSEEMNYYHMMFSQMLHFEVQEEDWQINLTSFFNDRPQAQMQTVPATNVYIQVNADESDRILVDPAYKLEKLKECNEKIFALMQAYRMCEEQMDKLLPPVQYQMGRDTFENWYNIELAIKKFDRIFNKVEKFDARKFSDPENHERREKRMLERKRKRQVENFTYFFGGLTEEEAQYRDYYETDVEKDGEDEFMEDRIDRLNLADNGNFNPKLYDFIDAGLEYEAHENYEDLVEDKLFKYRYRQCADGLDVYDRRMKRVMERFFERAKARDAAIEGSLVDTFTADMKDTSLGMLMLNNKNFKHTAHLSTNAHREYMAREGVQQYRDYYESDAEEQGFFEYLDNLPNRDQIRFMEAFQDFSRYNSDEKAYVLIPKREFNPELSTFSNLILDLVDFKDRVRPVAQDISMLDVTGKYQSRKVDEAVISDAFRQELINTEESQPGDFEEKRAISDQSAGEDAAVPQYLRFKSKKK